MGNSRYVDPFCEAGYRQIFSREESKELLIAMLNEMQVVINYYQFPYFDKQADECETLLDKMMHVFKNMTKLKQMPERFSEDVFKLIDKLAARD